MITDLIVRAQAGDEEAFRELVDPYRRELQLHCYRILGSLQDAEDAMQETLLAAWQGLSGFEGRASIRTWLYRVATSRCLDALRAGGRRVRAATLSASVDPPEPSRLSDLVWLEPYPDLMLEELADRAPGPEARYEASEAISLAFIAALQLLPPRQRAVLILRDVLGFRAAEAARILLSSEESVTSALKRARATLREQFGGGSEPAPVPGSAAEQAVVARFTRAFEACDLAGVVGLLTEDVLIAMPPVPLEYQGRELAAKFLGTVAFRPGRSVRLIATRANGQPAFGIYVRDHHGEISHASGVLVLTTAGDRIRAITRFDNSVLDRFGLPRTLPD